ncbi:transporter [Polaribacter batillariae]|uniref:Transporter n=1 Tax=Polaribacter batillariae TaxID=2808900 RepID=A0ABX7STJ4_9FLAO|nr:transporter [Polaribacter batillariae]QTD37481.1 transporter [Polaribacter batillariae]
MKKLFFAVFIFCSTIASAQFTESLSSDRPGQALSSSVVGKNVFQIQAGIDYFESTSNFYPSSYFRYGLSERFEFNTGIIFSGNKFADDLESLTIGARYVLNSNLEAHLKSSLQFSYDVGATNKNSQLTYILGSSFSEKLSYTVNLGINFDNDFGVNNGIYIFNFSYAFNDKTGVFLEPFGTFLKNSFQFNLDAGVYYLVNNNFQLDFLIGESDGFFTGAGITWRIPSKNN